MEGQKQDLDNFEDVVNFIADNTFMDGEALSSRFPGIADWLAANRAEAESFEEMFNLDQLRITPNVLLGEWVCTSENIDPYGNTYCEDGYYDGVGKKIADGLEEAGEVIADAFISYGFEPEVAAEWFMNHSAATSGSKP